MSDKHPYTNRQIIDFRKAAGQHVGLDEGDADLILLGLHEAGYTVTFPEPRYYVSHSVAEAYDVMDRQTGKLVASFHANRHPDARCAAQAEADRLNREAES